MSKLGISTGTAPNDGTGDSLLSGAVKINSNFDEIYSYFGDGNDLSFTESTWQTTLSGINTLSNVGVGTTNPRFALEVGYVGASGTSLWVNGDARVTGILTVGPASVTIDGVSNKITVGSGVTIDGSTGIISATSIILGDSTISGAGVTYITAGSGVSIDQNTGNVTISATGGVGSGVTYITAGSGVSVDQNTGNVTISATGIAQTANINADLLSVSGVSTFGSDVSIGGTVSVDGVSTFGSDVSIGGTVSVDGAVKLAGINTTIIGTAGTTGEIKQIGGAPFYYDGTAWREFYLIDAVQVTNTADTDWDNTILRMTFDDSGVFDDYRFGVTPTLIGSPTNTTAPVKIGTRALRLTDTSPQDALQYPYRSEYDFTGEWTMEFWINFNSITTDIQLTGTNSIISVVDADGANSTNSFALGARANTSNTATNFEFYWYNYERSSPQEESLTNVLTKSDYINQWHHIALVRQPLDGSLHFYIDGVESGITTTSSFTDNSINQDSNNDLFIGRFDGNLDNRYLDASIDDLRISTVARYTSIGSSTSTTFSPPTTQLPITGSTTTVVIPPTDKTGEIGLGSSASWRGTTGVTPTQQSSGSYRLTFTSSFTNADDYYVIANGIDQSFPTYVGITRSTTHVDFTINRQDNDDPVDTGYIAVQVLLH
jgi:hypothetical protein